MDQLYLLGLDFGSTTSSAIIASARVLRNCATGRMELGQPSVIYRSELVFTPFRADQIDERTMATIVDRWISESGVDPSSVAGGAIITGLAAQKSNVDAIETLVRERVSETLFATADDPCLESWLAFMGSCSGLSKAHTQTYFLNVDIGGGTTNLALGINGEVLRTGCLFAGARHFQFVPGSYQISALSPYAVRLLRDHAIDKSVGDCLSSVELRRILDFYVTLMEAPLAGPWRTRTPTWNASEPATIGRAGSGVRVASPHDGRPERSVWELEPFRYHVQVPFVPPPDADSPVITLSGGVGELVYKGMRGEALPTTTAYGDLGIDLARRLLQSPVLSQYLASFVPLNQGHATVYGLSLYSTEVSGTTLYLPDPGVLPLRDLPIVAKLRMDARGEDIAQAIDLASRSARGGCLEIADARNDLASVRQLGANIAAALREVGFPRDRALVLFASHNLGKTLGSYASEWGQTPVKLIVIDELVKRNARFASLGPLRNNIVPVSFYGMMEADQTDESFETGSWETGR